jgi:hypothetical protein
MQDITQHMSQTRRPNGTQSGRVCLPPREALPPNREDSSTKPDIWKPPIEYSSNYAQTVVSLVHTGTHPQVPISFWRKGPLGPLPSMEVFALSTRGIPTLQELVLDKIHEIGYTNVVKESESIHTVPASRNGPRDPGRPTAQNRGARMAQAPRQNCRMAVPTGHQPNRLRPHANREQQALRL